MKEFRHTKGPWIYDKRLYGSRITSPNISITYVNGDIPCIARVFRHKSAKGIKVYSDDEEAEANAKLIAAAPEMLDALIHQYTWVKGLYDLYKINETKHPQSDLVNTERDLRQLIENATEMKIEDILNKVEGC